MNAGREELRILPSVGADEIAAERRDMFGIHPCRIGSAIKPFDIFRRPSHNVAEGDILFYAGGIRRVILAEIDIIINDAARFLRPAGKCPGLGRRGRIHRENGSEEHNVVRCEACVRQFERGEGLVAEELVLGVVICIQHSHRYRALAVNLLDSFGTQTVLGHKRSHYLRHRIIPRLREHYQPYFRIGAPQSSAQRNH